jgi:hypothetical protein
MKKITTPNEHAHHIAVFQESTIRRVWHNEEWWFAIVDVVGVLTDSSDPRQYIKKMRSRDPALDANWGTTCTPLALQAPDGKQRETNCANTEGLFRIIQSIPSPKAEPFKRWLAQVGYERVKEIENPELASARARELYQAKGYPQAWIEKRLRSISVRGELTDEWKARGVAEGKEYSILTAEIARATFGVPPGEHSQLKGLDVVKTGNNLRDHMTDLELIFTMLGEAKAAQGRIAQGADFSAMAISVSALFGHFMRRPIAPHPLHIRQQLPKKRMPAKRGRIAHKQQLSPCAGHAHVHAADVRQEADLALGVAARQRDGNDVALLALKRIDGAHAQPALQQQVIQHFAVFDGVF